MDIEKLRRRARRHGLLLQRNRRVPVAVEAVEQGPQYLQRLFIRELYGWPRMGASLMPRRTGAWWWLW